jgi:hypothetical protein
MAQHDEEQDDELSASDWEGITVEDFDQLYRLLRSQYKEFHKRHRSSERTIQGLEGKINTMQLERNWTNTLMKSFINRYQWR